jgi:hypothetical protein
MMLRGRSLICAMAMLWAAPAVAQAPQPPKFQPFTVDEQSYNAIVNALLELKGRDGLPIINALAQMEQRAVADQKPKAEPPKAGEQK